MESNEYAWYHYAIVIGLLSAVFAVCLFVGVWVAWFLLGQY